MHQAIDCATVVVAAFMAVMSAVVMVGVVVVSPTEHTVVNVVAHEVQRYGSPPRIAHRQPLATRAAPMQGRVRQAEGEAVCGQFGWLPRSATRREPMSPIRDYC
jgi:hypothetical protein